jgi:hypothetical protein
MARKPTIVWTKLPLGQSSDLLDTPGVVIGPGGHLDIEIDIDNGAGAAFADAPVGTWQLWTGTGTDGTLETSTRYKQFTTTALTAALALLSPTGNNAVISSSLSLRGVPGRFAKLRYARSTGGSATVTGTASRARVTLTVDDA